MSNGHFQVPTPKNEPIYSYAPGSDEKAAIKETLARQLSEPAEIPLIIDGERITDRSKEAVVCPHDKGRVIAQTCLANEADIDRAIESCLAARKEWAALPWQERAAVFLKAADLLSTKYRYEINASTMLGQSKTVFQSEIDAVCELADFFRFNAHFAEKIYREQPMYSPDGQWNRTEVRGLEGFVFAVAPFNFTSISVNLPAAPALMGCTVLWKPSHTASYSSYLVYNILEEAGLPRGVINMVNGDPKMIGAKALNHSDLSGVHFTGSTNTFNHILGEVGKNMVQYKQYPRVVGETGGKDFIFAHESAQADELATALVRGAFEYQGQKCSAASRAYIPKSLWPAVKTRAKEMMDQITMGDPNDFTNFIGAVIDERAFSKITSYIDHAKDSSDAEIVAGGEYDSSKGYFVRPTLIEAKTSTYKSMVEEIFGPVLTVYVYDNDKFEETLEVCDTSTPYALTGSIFAKDRRVVNMMTRYLEHAAGNFYINDKPTGAVVGQQPFGGARASGTNDKAGSVYNLLRWVSHRTIKENFFSITDYTYPHMAEK